VSEFSFEYPYLLGVVLLFIVCAKWCKQRDFRIYFPHIDQPHHKRSILKSQLLGLLKWAGILLAIAALASPIEEHKIKNSHIDGRDIVLLIDSSASMGQGGFDRFNPYKSRFDLVKEVVGDFIKKRKKDRLALLNFADVSYIASPLTYDRKFLKQVNHLQRLGVAGRRTALYDSLVQAYDMLSGSKAKTKIVIALTDGVDTASHIGLDELKILLMEQKGIKLYTIGIGRVGRDYDPQVLKGIAKAARGVGYEARNVGQLKAIYEKINQLETSTLKAKQLTQKIYLYIYPLVASVLLLLLYLLLRSKKGGL